MGDIIDGDLASIKSQTVPVIFVDVNGNDLGTGINVIAGGLASVKADAVAALLIDASGNSL